MFFIIRRNGKRDELDDKLLAIYEKDISSGTLYLGKYPLNKNKTLTHNGVQSDDILYESIYGTRNTLW